MEMNRLGILVIAAAAAVCVSCVRSESSGLNDANKRYFDAWMKINHPDAKRDGLGIYILEETAGTGISAGKAEDFVDLFKRCPKADAGLAASIFHYGEVRIPDVKKLLIQNGIPAREV